MASRDILDSGSLTIPANGNAAGAWVPSQGLRDIVALLKLPVSGVNAVIQESDDSNNVLYEWYFTAGTTSGTYRVALQPGASVLRLYATSSNATSTQVYYAIRALG